MVVTVDGAGSARAGRLHRLLRRSLLIAALAAGAWLLSVLFANSASAAAATPPADDPVTVPVVDVSPAPQQLTGALGVVTDTVTHAVQQVNHTVGTLTQTVARTTHVALPAVAAQPDRDQGRLSPVAQLLAPLGFERAAVAPAPAAPPRPPATPAKPATVAPAPEHTPRAPADESRPSTSGQHERHGTSGPHAGPNHPGQPAKAPAPVAPGGTIVAVAHDHAGHERGILAVQTASAALPSPAPGFTTRSRAADGTGRVAGLPATSPD
jgi:hypothetical protein